MSTPGDALLPALVLLSPAVLENGLKATFVAIIALLPFELAIEKRTRSLCPDTYMSHEPIETLSNSYSTSYDASPQEPL
jgi:hypothetical protein